MDDVPIDAASEQEDEYAGYHKLVGNTGLEIGTFEVFYVSDRTHELAKDKGYVFKPGWYWWIRDEGQEPSSQEIGPFDTAKDAFDDAGPL